MAEHEERLEYRPANIEINAQVCAGDIGGITHKCGRSFEHAGADEGPDDNAEADIANEVCRGAANRRSRRPLSPMSSLGRLWFPKRGPILERRY